MLVILRLREMLSQPRSAKRCLKRLKKSLRFFHVVFIDYPRPCGLQYVEVMYAVPAQGEISASYLEDKYRETTVLPRLRILKVLWFLLPLNGRYLWNAMGAIAMSWYRYLNNYFDFHVCLSIRPFVRPSVRVSRDYIHFLQLCHKMSLIKVVWYVLRVKNMHPGSPSDPSGTAATKAKPRYVYSILKPHSHSSRSPDRLLLNEA